jgi:hypothetical protein
MAGGIQVFDDDPLYDSKLFMTAIGPACVKTQIADIFLRDKLLIVFLTRIKLFLAF